MSKLVKYIIVTGIVFVLLEGLSFSFLKDMNEKAKIIEKEKTPGFFSRENSTLIKMKLPAVSYDGKGISSLLIVEATKGSGKTLVDIDNLLFWADTQQSIRMARYVAGNLSKNEINDYDLVYRVEANASLIGGPSAGAAISIATIFALNNESLKDNVMITGTINHDGTIGPVSDILEKAKAAKNSGADLFLVPLLNSADVVYESREHCQQFGGNEVCVNETVPRKVNIEQETGIKIVEVESVREALGYFR